MKKNKSTNQLKTRKINKQKNEQYKIKRESTNCLHQTHPRQELFQQPLLMTLQHTKALLVAIAAAAIAAAAIAAAAIAAATAIAATAIAAAAATPVVLLTPVALLRPLTIALLQQDHVDTNIKTTSIKVCTSCKYSNCLKQLQFCVKRKSCRNLMKHFLLNKVRWIESQKLCWTLAFPFLIV